MRVSQPKTRHDSDINNNTNKEANASDDLNEGEEM